MASSIENLIKVLTDFPDILTERVVEKIQPLFDDKLHQVVESYYGDYTSQSKQKYIRTNNFINSAKSNWSTNGANSHIEIGEGMKDYPGFSWGNSLDADVAWQYNFEEGEHGHGKYLKATTEPSPYETMQNYVDNNFDGKLIDIMLQTANEILQEIK